MPLNIFNGSNWNPFKKIQVHNGSTWVDSKASYIWNGTEWKLFSTGVPENTVAPSFSQQSGLEGLVEQTVSITTGTWDNTPTSYRYVWESAPYSNSSYSWSPLIHNGVAQVNSTAYVNFNYVGYLIRCKVYASNAVGESEPKIVEPGIILGPEKIPFFTAYPVSDGRIYMLWQKSKGANGYYVQYQGPEVSFTELILPANNEEPGTSVGTEFGNKYLELGTSTRGTLGITIWPTNNSNPFSNILGSRIQGGARSVSLSTIRTSTPAVINSSSISGTVSSQYPSLVELTMNVNVGSYGNPSGALDYYWGPGYIWNGGNYMVAERNGQTISCTASITNSEGTVSSTAYYNTDVYVPPAPVITYGPCETYSESNFTGSECSGTYYREIYTNVKEKRKTQYSDGVATGEYDYNCTAETNTTYGTYREVDGLCGYTTPAPACVCNYSTSPTDSIHFAPECCPGGSQRSGSLSGTTVNACCPNVSKTATGKFACSDYDVNNEASVNWSVCYTVGACTANSDPAGVRSRCYS
jgi:hypothetical protein